MSSPPPTLSFVLAPKPMLTLLDQTLLPHTVAFATMATAYEVAAHIQSMTVRGAPAIGLAAAFGMALAHLRGEDLDKTKAMLDASRPTAVNLAWATAHMLQCAKTMSGVQLAEEANRLLRADYDINAAMAQHGVALLYDLVPRKPTLNVLTHCNTGALACSGIGTALGVVTARHKRDANVFVWVDETRPRLQGAKLTAWELQQAGIPFAVVCDNAAASLMLAGKVDVVLVGADRVCANGDVVNKIGTYSLAALCHHHGIPFVCVAPTSSVDLRTPNGAAVVIEERSTDEVLAVEGCRIAPHGANAFNPAFDATPFTLVSAIVTERGICRAPYAQSLEAAKASAAPARSAPRGGEAPVLSTRVTQQSGGGNSTLKLGDNGNARGTAPLISTRVTQQSGGGNSSLKLGSHDGDDNGNARGTAPLISTRVTQQSGGGRSTLQLGDPTGHASVGVAQTRLKGASPQKPSRSSVFG